jgi:uroporphyrinogen decarboxylase
MNDLLLRAARREPIERPPVWMMRQAGRYLPEYRKVRERADFLTMCRTPELAVEVTLQPVDLIGVDAAIIFSDILVIPDAMGMNLSVDEGVGPRIHDPVRSLKDVGRLKPVIPEESLAYQLEAITLARRELNGRVPLIGFAGSPWTLASYMIEGGGTKGFHVAKKFLANEPEAAHQLLSLVADAVGDLLVAQVKAGAQIVQVFESWAGALAPADFRTFALPYMARVVRKAKTTGVPVIAFAPGANWAREEIADATGADVIGIDWQTEPATARQRLSGHAVALQGNFDPCWLYAPIPEIIARTNRMLDAFGGERHIANLGHGILPDVPVAHAKAFVETVQAWRAKA